MRKAAIYFIAHPLRDDELKIHVVTCRGSLSRFIIRVKRRERENAPEIGVSGAFIASLPSVLAGAEEPGNHNPGHAEHPAEGVERLGERNRAAGAIQLFSAHPRDSHCGWKAPKENVPGVILIFPRLSACATANEGTKP